MLWLLPCMPCSPWFQLHCKPCLDDLFSLEICFSTFLFLQISTPFLHVENNWSMMHYFMPTKSISILTIWLVKMFSNMTKPFKASLLSWKCC
ncbi:hypothetical protein ACHAXS_002065 [Conticribra weissflogii]